MRRLRMPPLVVVVIVAGAAGVARAQDEIVLDLFRSRVDIAADRLPDRPFNEDVNGNPVDGDYGSSSVSLFANIPLGGVHVRPGKKVVASQWFVGGMYQRSSPDITFLSQDHTLTNGVLNASRLWLSRGRELYLVSAGASFAEDQDTLSDLKPRFFGLFVGTHRFNPETALLYGGAFTYVFGRGLPLPIIGVRWRINPKWTLTGMVPFTVDARYAARRDLAVRIRLAPQGNLYRFSNQGDFPGQDEVVHLRTVHGKLTGELEWVAARNFTLLVQGGVIRARKFAFADEDNNDFLDTSTPATGYARVAARFIFGKTLLDQWEP